MRGFPGHMNTKRDFQNCMKTMPEETRAALRALLDARFVMAPVRKIGGGENLVPAPGQEIRHVCLSSGPDGADAAPEAWLYAPQEDPNAKIFQLGYTVAEVEALIAL